jgi:hypothetical protein
VKRRFAFWVLALCLPGSGCSLVCNATNNITAEVCQRLDDCTECIRNERWASQAWRETLRRDPGHSYSPDYVAGFKAGFADLLAAGGTGEPPPVPPPNYWAPRYQTPQGYHAIEDWFAGFRHGALVARDSGYRRWMVLPSGLPHPDEGPPRMPPPSPPPPLAGDRSKPPPSAPQIPPTEGTPWAVLLPPRPAAPPGLPHSDEGPPLMPAPLPPALQAPSVQGSPAGGAPSTLGSEGAQPAQDVRPALHLSSRQEAPSPVVIDQAPALLLCSSPPSPGSVASPGSLAGEGASGGIWRSAGKPKRIERADEDGVEEASGRANSGATENELTPCSTLPGR